MQNSSARNSMPYGNVYLWIPHRWNALRGRVIAGRVPLPGLDTSGEGSGRLWGRHVRVRNGGEINEPLASKSGSCIVPIGDALPHADGDFIFDPGRGGGRIDKVHWDKPSASPVESPESRVPFPEPQF